MAFTLCETVAAFIAGSEAMMGDSAAMFVDALTYLFNLVAERRKSCFEEEQCDGVVDQDPVITCRMRQRAKRKMTLHLELVPPLVSVTSLIIVTAFVLRKAIRVLILDIYRDISKQGDPNINLMLVFSCVNLALDFVNVFYFARANHLMGYDTHIEETKTSYDHVETTGMGLDGNGIHGASHMEHDLQGSNGAHEHGDSITSPLQEQSNRLTPHSVDEKQTDEQEEKEGANLNMCSAYTVSLVLPFCCCSLWCSFISCFCFRSMSLLILYGVLQ
jgi:Co/Zn/Cd efflux system component